MFGMSYCRPFLLTIRMIFLGNPGRILRECLGNVNPEWFREFAITVITKYVPFFGVPLVPQKYAPCRYYQLRKSGPKTWKFGNMLAFCIQKEPSWRIQGKTRPASYLGILKVMPPQRPDLVLTTNVPNRKTYILIFHSLNIKSLKKTKQEVRVLHVYQVLQSCAVWLTDSWYCSDYFSKF